MHRLAQLPDQAEELGAEQGQFMSIIESALQGLKKYADFKGRASRVEFWAFLKERKKFWLAPIIMVMLLFGALLLLQGTVVAPFIYTLF